MEQPIEKSSPDDNYEYPVDIFFSNSYKSALKSAERSKYLFFLRPVILSFLLILNSYLLNPTSMLFLPFCLSFIIYSAFFSVQHCYVTSLLRNVQIIKQLANQINHTAYSLQHYYCEETRLSTSTTIYDFNTLQRLEDVPIQEQRLKEARGVNLISSSIYQTVPCHSLQSIIIGLISLTLFVLGQVAINAYQISEYEKTVIIATIATEVMLQITVYVCAVVIIISPLVCFLLTIVVCCCVTKKKVLLPKKQKATIEHVVKANDCPICFQSIGVGDDIMVLPCSDRHIFHDLCISSWCKVRPVCPMCRHQLTE